LCNRLKYAAPLRRETVLICDLVVMHGRSEEGRDKFAGAGLALLAERARLIIFPTRLP
jgi:hypothetical protein